MRASSSICHINRSHLYITRSEMCDMGARVISLPSLDHLHDYLRHSAYLRDSVLLTAKKHASVDEVGAELIEQHPISCMMEDNVILGDGNNCGYITSSHSSSLSSASLIADTIELVQRLTSVYDYQDSQSLLDSDLLNADYINADLPISGLQTDEEISLSVPHFPTKVSECSEDIAIGSTPIESGLDGDNPLSTLSSFSPTHKQGVPSKAAAILGAREVFISPSHAAYRRLVDYTHRPTNVGQSLLNTEAPFPPTLVHLNLDLQPSLTARPQRKSKPEMKPMETSPEKKTTSKYKIISIGIDDVKEKLNFLKRPGGEMLGQNANCDTNATKLTKSKDADKLLKVGGASMKQIRKWSQSFEELLHDKYGLALFHEYLKSEYSEENIEFWIACEEYKAITNPKKMAIRAHKIIKDFVATQASKEVNLDSKTRQLTLENIHHPNTKMFEMAQKRIQTLMEIDSYQRFLRSAMYQSLVHQISEARLSTNENTEPDNTATVSRSISNSLASSVDILDPDSVLTELRDFRQLPAKQENKYSSSASHNSSSSSASILRISSMKTARNDNSSSPNIPPSNSDHCLQNTTR